MARFDALRALAWVFTLAGCDIVVGLNQLSLDRDAGTPLRGEVGGQFDGEVPLAATLDAGDPGDAGDTTVDATLGGRGGLDAPDAREGLDALDAAADTRVDANVADADPICQITGSCPCLDKSTCLEGAECCAGRCTDVSRSVEHCGACGHGCSGNRICEQGSCSCGGLDPLCAAVCVDYFSDPENCGQCGHSCLGGECVGGACRAIALATAQPEPVAVAVDRYNAYFANLEGDSVGRVSKGGPPCAGAACILHVSPILNAPAAIATDGTNVFVAAWARGGPGGAIVQLPTSLASATVLATARGPWALASANGRVYYATQNEATVIGSVPVNGGTSEALAVGAPLGTDVRALVVDGASVVWGTRESTAAGSLFHASAFGTCGPGGCAPTTTSTGAPQGMALDGEWLYWTAADGKVRKMLKSGGCKAILPCPIVLAESQPDPYAIVADGADVWWTNRGDGSVRRGSAYRMCRGSRCQAVAAGLGNVSGLAQDAQALYMTSRSLPGGTGRAAPSGAVWRLAK